MRYIIFLSILRFALLSFDAVQAQTPLEVRVSGDWPEGTRLGKALAGITEDYAVDFAYDADLLKRKTVSGSFRQKPLSVVLDTWLPPNGLAYELAAGIILVYPHKAAKQPSPATYSLSGTVRDASTGEALPYAHLRVMPSGRGAVSDADGRFSLLEIDSGQTALAVSYMGYAPDTVAISQRQAGHVLHVRLVPHERMLQEVTVESTHRQVVRSNPYAGMQTINPLQLQRVATTGQGNILQALQLLPGVGAASETSNGLHIWGGKPGQNLILFDGFTIYHIDHVFGMFDAINADAVKHIRLYKGGFPARYGDRASSVIDITGKDGNQNAFAGSLGVDLLSARACIETPLGPRTTFMGTFRHSFTQFFQEEFYNDFFNSFFTSGMRNRRVAEQLSEQTGLQPQVRFYDMNAKITHESAEAGKLALSVFKGDDKLEIQEESTSRKLTYQLDERSEWGNQGTSLRWAYPWNSQHESQISAAFSGYKGRDSFEEAYEGGRTDTRETFATQTANRLNALSLRASHQTYWRRHKTRVGAAFSAYRTVFRRDVQNLSLDELHQQAQQFTFFAENEFFLGDDAALTIGMRGMYQDALNLWFAEPRVAAWYAPRPALRLKVAYGWYHQFISQLETSGLQSSEPVYWLLADGNLFGETGAHHYILGAAWKKRRWSVEAEAYYKQTDGIIGSQALLVPFYQPDSALTPLQFPRNGQNQAYGLDVMLQGSRGGFSGWLAYSWNSSNNRFAALNRGEPYPAAYQRTHELNIVLNYSWKQWLMGAKWIFATGSPYTQPDPELGIRELFDKERVNAYRLPDYHRLDISVSRKFRWGKTFAQAGLNLINVYNRTNLRSRVYRVEAVYEPQNGQTGGQPERTIRAYDLELMHFMPVLFLRWQF